MYPQCPIPEPLGTPGGHWHSCLVGAPSPRGSPGRTQWDLGQEDDTVHRPSGAAIEHGSVAEEVRGALAQAAGRPDVVEAQEAAAAEGQAPAALGVVHGGGGGGCAGHGPGSGAGRPLLLCPRAVALCLTSRQLQAEAVPE
jgi:hypothetical protein